MATTPKVKMIVTKAHKFDGRRVEVGEQIEATPKVAKLQRLLKRATLVVEVDGEEPSSNTYETRVMRAENTPQAAAATRRTYSGRRNMTAK